MSATTPAPQSLALARAGRVADNLRRCERKLANPAIAPTLRGHLLVELRTQAEALSDVVRRLRRRAAPGDLWAELAECDRNAEIVTGDVLAVLEGVLIRRAGLDDGLCTAADALADELTARTHVEWVRVSLLAAAEQFDPRSRRIHLRFPEHTTWALPLVAHEFGHLVGQDLRALRADGTDEQLVETEVRDSGLPVPHARELFADVFAAYVLGPAYGCTAILLRLDPTVGDSETHPADGKRVHVILEALEAAPDRAGAVSALLRRAWVAARGARADPMDADTAGELSYLVRRIFLPLLRRRLPEAAYDGTARAQALRRALSAGDGAVPPQPLPVCDVLNAAWLERLDRWDEAGAADDIDHAALALLGRGRTETAPAAAITTDALDGRPGPWR